MVNRFNRRLKLASILFLLLVLTTPTVEVTAQSTGRVYNAQIEAHWLEGDTAFWYQLERPGGQRDTFLVDAETGNIEAIASPPVKQNAELVAEAEARPSGKRGSETQIIFQNQLAVDVNIYWINEAGERKAYGAVEPGGQRDQHTFGGHVWLVEDSKQKTLGVYEANPGGIPAANIAVIDGRDLVKRKRGERGRGDRNANATAVKSPDGKWEAFVKNHDLYVRPTQGEPEVRLSKHGNAKNSFHRDAIRARAIGMNYTKPNYPPSLPDVYWSPDSKRLIAIKTRVVNEPRVYMVESSPKDQLQPKLHSYPYIKPGDPIPQGRLYLYEIEKADEIAIDHKLFKNPWSLSRFEWSKDSSVFRLLYNRRGHQVMRFIEVNGQTGAARTIINEKNATFIDYSQKTHLTVMEERGEAVWMSERSGWNHLYLYDLKTGAVKNAITSGPWLVRGVDRIDEQNQRIYFRIMGYHKDQDPYYIHHARINFDGSGLTLLTQANGTHTIKSSPGERWYIDTWSRVDKAPAHELRRASDGAFVVTLGEADANALYAEGRHPPERFVAKGRDGKTNIHGIIHRPADFDPTRVYPVIESIYAGPHGQHVPKEFRASYRTQQQIADAGYIVVQIDGMGTNWRHKAFHDVAWKNLADAGFKDRIAWMKAAARTRPWMDISRVGIFGGSAGGQNAMRAVLDHHAFYKAAAADCGCHDNRMDKIWWNEAWMGWPVDESYTRSSNTEDAAKLGAALLLTVGELDKNVDPASTMQVVDALGKAGKDFDLLVVPGGGHGSGGAGYGRQLRLDFFDQHLKNKQ